MNLDELVQAMQTIYPTAMRTKDYTVATDDAGNATIATWNNALGAQPTTDQLTSALTVIQLAAAKTAQLALLTLSYNGATSANVPYMETNFLADPDSQNIFGQALTIYNAVGSVPDGFFTADSTGTKVPMTLAQLQGLGVAIAAQVWASFQRWVAVRESLAAATTIAEVQAVIW